MAQYYHLDLERMGEDYTLAHAARLAAHLPAGSRCDVAGDPHGRWDDGTRLLWRIERELNLLRWRFAPFEGEGQPEPLPYPGHEEDARAAMERFIGNKQSVDAAFGLEGGDDGKQ